jgi:hypothetical protein
VDDDDDDDDDDTLFFVSVSNCLDSLLDEKFLLARPSFTCQVLSGPINDQVVPSFVIYCVVLDG